MRRLRAGPVELEFDLELARIESAVPTRVPADEGATGVAAELSDLAHQRPEAAILESFYRVERKLQQLVYGDADPPAVGAGRLAREALQRGLISPETMRAIDGIAVLRNLTAHNRSGADITADRAVDYLHLVDAVLYTMGQDPPGRD